MADAPMSDTPENYSMDGALYRRDCKNSEVFIGAAQATITAAPSGQATTSQVTAFDPTKYTQSGSQITVTCLPGYGVNQIQSIKYHLQCIDGIFQEVKMGPDGEEVPDTYNFPREYKCVKKCNLSNYAPNIAKNAVVNDQTLGIEVKTVNLGSGVTERLVDRNNKIKIQCPNSTGIPSTGETMYDSQCLPNGTIFPILNCKSKYKKCDNSELSNKTILMDYVRVKDLKNTYGTTLHGQPVALECADSGVISSDTKPAFNGVPSGTIECDDSEWKITLSTDPFWSKNKDKNAVYCAPSACTGADYVDQDGNPGKLDNPITIWHWNDYTGIFNNPLVEAGKIKAFCTVGDFEWYRKDTTDYSVSVWVQITTLGTVTEEPRPCSNTAYNLVKSSREIKCRVYQCQFDTSRPNYISLTDFITPTITYNGTPVPLSTTDNIGHGFISNSTNALTLKCLDSNDDEIKTTKNREQITPFIAK